MNATGTRRTTSVLSPGGGYVDQTFVATGEELQVVRVQANINHGTSGETQSLSVELRTGDGLNRFTFSDGTITDQPGFRVFEFKDRPRLTCGTTYVLRVINRVAARTGTDNGEVVLGMDHESDYAPGAARAGAGSRFSGLDTNLLVCTLAGSTCPLAPQSISDPA